MSEEHILIVDTPTRLDQLLARQWEALDGARIRALIRDGAVVVNGVEARKPGQRLTPDDEVTVLLPDLEPAPAPSAAPGVTISVAYEDDALLVVEKPANIPVRRSRDPEQATLPQLLAERFPDMAHVGGVNRAGVVTTLGEDVSGLVLAGKSEDHYRDLRRSVKRQEVTEIYTALVDGHLEGEYTIEQPIGNAKHARRRLAVAREGRPAVTYVRAQQHYKDGPQEYTLVYVRPESSRMHQIRVHLSWYGFPIVGDRIYGPRRQTMLPDRIFLHLSMMELRHPVTEESIKIGSELPPELNSILTFMRRPKWS